MDKPLQSSEAKLAPILEASKELTYLYDFGDSWEHHITLEDIIQNYPESYAMIIEAGEACPPEDVGGPPGYLDFLVSWYDPAQPDHVETKAWGQGMGYTDSFDQKRANLFLRHKQSLSRDLVSKACCELNTLVFPASVPMAFRVEITEENIRETHRFKYFRDFLGIIKELEPLKLTAKGNLPAKLVANLSQQGYDFLEPKLPKKVSREDQAWFLAELHHLGKRLGLFTKRHGKLMVTKKGATVGENAPLLYFSLWQVLLNDHLEGYKSGYEDLHPIFMGYLLELLKKYGGTEREFSFYVEYLLRVDPYVWDEYGSDPSAKNRFTSRVFGSIVQNYFAELGIVATRSVFNKDDFRFLRYVRTTDLFSRILVSW